MRNFFEKFQALPEDLQKKVIDFTESLEKKNKQKTDKKKSLRKGFSFGWAGALADMKDEYTSVELQKKILEWW